MKKSFALQQSITNIGSAVNGAQGLVVMNSDGTKTVLSLPFDGQKTVSMNLYSQRSSPSPSGDNAKKRVCSDCKKPGEVHRLSVKVKYHREDGPKSNRLEKKATFFRCQSCAEKYIENLYS